MKMSSYHLSPSFCSDFCDLRSRMISLKDFWVIFLLMLYYDIHEILHIWAESRNFPSPSFDDMLLISLESELHDRAIGKWEIEERWKGLLFDWFDFLSIRSEKQSFLVCFQHLAFVMGYWEVFKMRSLQMKVF